MYVLIAEDGSLSVEDADNFRGFSIVEIKGCPEAGTAASALKNISEPAEDSHFWIDATEVVNFSGRADNSAWVDQFWEMLAKSEPYGYSDMQNKRVKAHVEQR
jgi:hypothetical protein